MAHSELHCPHCGSDRVQIYDHQPLATADKETPIDKEIYVSLKCDICSGIFHTVGDITYRQPKPIKKVVKVVVELVVNQDCDTQELLDNVHDALLLSDNVTTKAVVQKEYFVVSES